MTEDFHTVNHTVKCPRTLLRSVSCAKGSLLDTFRQHPEMQGADASWAHRRQRLCTCTSFLFLIGWLWETISAFIRQSQGIKNWLSPTVLIALGTPPWTCSPSLPVDHPGESWFLSQRSFPKWNHLTALSGSDFRKGSSGQDTCFLDMAAPVFYFGRQSSSNSDVWNCKLHEEKLCQQRMSTQTPRE